MSEPMSYSLSLETEVAPDMPEDEVHSCKTDCTYSSQANREIPNG